MPLSWNGTECLHNRKNWNATGAVIVFCNTCVCEYILKISHFYMTRFLMVAFSVSQKWSHKSGFMIHSMWRRLISLCEELVLARFHPLSNRNVVLLKLTKYICDSSITAITVTVLCLTLCSLIQCTYCCRSSSILTYTVSQKKLGHFYFYDTLGKYGPISIILSLVNS